MKDFIVEVDGTQRCYLELFNSERTYTATSYRWLPMNRYLIKINNNLFSLFITLHPKKRKIIEYRNNILLKLKHLK